MRSQIKFTSTLFKGWQGVKGGGATIVASAEAKYPKL